MVTRIDVEYDRQYSNAELQEMVARATVTVNVMQQLGAPYQSLPGMAMAAYQTEIDAMEADMSALSALINQIQPLLISLDNKALPLFERNKKALKTLSGLLQTSAEKTLLDQITGPTHQSGGNSPASPPASPPPPVSPPPMSPPPMSPPPVTPPPPGMPPSPPPAPPGP